MRTTVSIADPILTQAKDLARDRGQSLGQVVEQALRRELMATPVPARRVQLPVSSAGGGPQPGVDLTSNRSMYEAMEGSGIPRVAF